MIRVLRKIMSGNRRKYPRVQTGLAVSLKLPGDATPIETRTRNLSASGMEVLLTQAVPILAEASIDLHFPAENETMHLRGKLVRSMPARSLWDRLRHQSQRYAVAISFIDMEHSERAKLIRYLQRVTQ